jgi:hypothetical protein
MAGSTMERPARKGLLVRLMAVGVCVAVGSLYAASAAQAQVPGVPGVPVPDVPPVPAPVYDAYSDARGTIVPVLVDAAVAGQPAANAAGFALRPACANAGTAVLLIAIGGGSLPVSPAFVSVPLFVFCGGAWEPGPADPVLKDVDAAVGPQLSSQLKPVMTQASDALAPVRPNIAAACGALSLVGSPTKYAPKPLHRITATKPVCGF